jgi:exodeoxyribonuclease VII large subunit
VRLAAAARRLLGRRAAALAAAERRLGLRHPARRLGERMQRLDELQSRALLAVRRENRARGDRLRRLEAELASRSPAVRLAALAQRTAQAGGRLEPVLRTRLTLAGARLLAAARALQVASPLATLERGYAIVTRAADGALISDAGTAPPGTEIEVRLARGTLAALAMGPRGGHEPVTEE